MEERNYKLYVHISPSNKRYYGITSEDKVQDRWKNGKAYSKNKHFTNAINKYGWDNFQHIVLFNNLTKEEASLLEQMYIALYNTFDDDYGYNQSLGGENNVWSEKSKKKMSESRKGKHHTEEAKKNISEGMKAHHTEETKKQISESLKAYYSKKTNKGRVKGRVAWNKGKQLTEEHKKNMSEALKGKNNPNSKPVLMFTKDNEFIKRFDCISDANEYLEKPRNSTNIHQCACTKCKTPTGKTKTAYGYIWIYEEDYIKEQEQAI